MDASNFRETNSISAMLIRAVDTCYDSSESWKGKSEKEKEQYLGEIILKHIEFHPPGGRPCNDARNFQEINSISTMLIRAADTCYDSNESWKSKPKEKKEEDLGRAILSHNIYWV